MPRFNVRSEPSSSAYSSIPSRLMEGESDPAMVPPTIAFISGPIEPTEDYFDKYYAPNIKTVIAAGHSFVMGPAPGMDTMACHYLIRQNVEPSRITIYFAEFQQRLMADHVQCMVDLGVNVKVEGITTSDRDAAMTRDSDYDILRYMTVEEQQQFYGERYHQRVSATEKNERRRKGLPLTINRGLSEDGKARDKVEKRGRRTWRSCMERFYVG